MYTETKEPNNFHPEDGGRILTRNFHNITHNHKVLQPKNTISINNEPFWKPKISKYTAVV
jgi:hypothetical protein